MSATLKDLYNALKKDGRFSEAKDFGTFAKKMNERGYSSMVYNTVRNAGASVPDIATFRKNLGVHVWMQGEGKENLRAKPTSAVGKVAQSVEHERWGDTALTRQSLTASTPEGQASLLQTDNSSVLVKAMQQSQLPKLIERPIDYAKPGALVKSEQRRQKHLDEAFKQSIHDYVNEKNMPAFKTSIAGADSMIKRQGQLEKELEDSANLLANDKSISDYLSNSIFGEFKEANKRAADISRGFTKTGTVSDAGVDIAQSILRNQQKDPEKLLKNLQEKTKNSMISLLSTPDMRRRIESDANRMGVPVDYYVQNALAPKIQERLAEEFDKAQVAKYLPKGTAEYVASGINDSLIGTVLQMATMNKSQRVYMQRANAMTQEGLNPNVKKPGMWANAARGAISFVADAPLFALLSPIGGSAAAGVLGNGVKITARMANASWYGRMGLMATQGAISQGTTGFIYGGLNSAVQNYSTGDDTSLANTARVAAGGAFSEAASWATMGAFGGAVGGSLYKAGLNGTGKNVWRNGAAKIGSDVLKIGAEGMGMHLGGNMAKVVRGEDTNWFSTEGLLEDCANVVALKLSHAPKLLVKAASAKREIGEDGKKESYVDFAARNFATYLISDAAKGERFKFTEEEKKEFKPYVDTFGVDIKGLLRTKNAKASDAASEKIKTVYDQIMADENITWDAKAKYNALVMGTVPSVRPIMDYCTVATHGDDKVVEERAKDGTLLSRTTFDTTDAKNAIEFRLLQSKERQRMANAYSGLLLKDCDNEDIKKEYMRSLGYDFENPDNPRNKVIEESMAKAREDFENGADSPDGANNIYKGWLDFAYQHGELKNIEEGFCKEKGLSQSEFNKIYFKNPWERTDEEHQIMVDYRHTLEKALFPEDKVHEEQSQQGGKDVAEENNLGGENPNGEAVKGTLAELNQAEKGLQALMDSNEVFKSEYERLKKQGLSNAQIYQALIDSGMTQEELTPFAKYINANAKVQGMVDGTKKKIDKNVQERVMEWSYKGELNGEKQSGENMVYVTDDKGRVLVVASGDVAFDSEGKPKEDVGDMLVVYDTATGEVDFVSAKDVKFHSTESAEDYGKRYTQHLQELNSQAYTEAAQEQQGGENVPQQEGTGVDNVPNNAGGESGNNTPNTAGEGSGQLGEGNNGSQGEGGNVPTFKDGTPIPMTTDSKGRPTGDLPKMSPEHGAEYLETTLGEMADEFVDGKIKAAEKAVDKAKKKKVDMSGDVTDVQEAIAKKNEEITKAEAELNMYTNIKKARAKNQLDEEADNAIGSGGMDTTGRYDKEREQGYRIGEGNVRYDRQKEEDQTGEYGKDVTVAFSPDVKVKGKVKIVEADSVQASHSNGQQNPYHFGHDWQPKDRTSADSSLGANKIASNIDPEQITGDGNAFVSSAPSVNKRHEVIQGNNRTEALKRMYAGYPEQAAKYKQWLIDHAEDFGLNAEEIAKMKNPIMVNELPVDDATAKQLGQYVASDFETGGKRIPAESIVINKLGKRMENFANILLSQGELGEDAKLSDLIMQNAGRVLEYLQKEGVINNTEANTLAKDKVALRQWLDGMLRAGLFEGDKQTEAAFNKLPENAKKAVLATYLRDVKSGEGARIKQNLQRSFEAYSDLMNNSDFANAKNLKEARAAVAAEIEHGNKSMFGEEPIRDRYSTFELELAALYKGLKDQKTLAGLFGKYFDAVQGDKATNRQLELGEEPREPISKENAIKEVFDSYDTIPAETQKQVDEAVKGVAVEISKRVGEDLVVTDEKTAEKKIAENEDELKYQTSDEIDKKYPNWLEGTTNDNGKHTTQVAGTVGTYKKVGAWVANNLGKGTKILDASSGMGLGTKELREQGFNIEDVEPYQSEDRKKNNPATYASYDEVKGKYDFIISNAVLNVIPDDWRSNVLHDMASRLNDGGKLFINTRKAGEEKSIKDKIELDSPQEVLVKRNGKIASYQRFFTPTELRDWVKKELGDGYDAEVANEKNSGTKGLAAVVVTKKSSGVKRFFRTKDGEVYGFTDGKKIYLDTKKMKPDTPLHEYTHLWGAALRRTNKKEWENVKGLLDKVDGLKEEIQKTYPELKGDDLYDEMLAMFSGREGTKKLEDVCRKLAAEEGKRVTDSAKEQGFIDKVKTALQKFWKATADLLHVHFTSAEDVADKVLADWARGFDPREKANAARRGGFRNIKNSEKLELDKEPDVTEKFAKEKATFVGDSGEYADVLRESKTVMEAVGKFRKMAADARAEAKDWASRVYKKNKATIDSHDMYGDEKTTTVQAANERRRNGRVRALEKAAAEYEECAETLLKRCGLPKDYGNEAGKLRFQKADDVEATAKEHGVDTTWLARYAEDMKEKNSAAAWGALHDLKAMYLREHTMEKKALMEREGVSGLIANRRLFAPIEKAIKEKYGDVDVLIEEHRKQAEIERGVMEAARKRKEEEERKRQERLDELTELSDEEIDKQYADALEKGDEATAREMIDEAARRKGYSDATSDYQGVGAWSAPSDPGYATAEERRADIEENGGAVNVEDIAAGYSPVQEEMYSHPERTGFGDEAGIEAGRAINNALNALKAGKKDVKIKVYRAVPTSVKEGKLRNGDWVTPSRKYAENHGNSRLEGKYRIIETEVPAGELWFDGNDIREWGYDNGKSYRYKNGKNNRKLNDLVTRDDKGNVIPPSKRFNSRKADERYQKVNSEQAKADKREKALRDEVVGTMRKAGLDVSMDTEKGQRVLDEVNGKAKLSAKKRRALETASVSQDGKHQQTAISSADGAKVLKNLDSLAGEYENSPSTKEKTFIGEVADSLGIDAKDKSSKYATFETKNGRIVTIRLSNHNAKVSNFDNRDESEGISIVVSPKKSEGMTNDGAAHVVEYYYDALKLRRADGKPLADIVRSIKQVLYSGEFTDTTGLAERQEVNAEDVVRYNKVYHGSGADFDHFDHSHMGEGEGAQAYGWGTYVTEVEGIGKAYAKVKDGPTKQSIVERKDFIKRRKKDIRDMGDYEKYARRIEKVRKENVREYNAAKKAGDESDMKFYADLIAINDEQLKPENHRKTIESFEADITKAEKEIAELEQSMEGKHNLYTVEIPDDTGENYLDWVNALTDGQIGRIREYLRANYRRNKVDDFDASMTEVQDAPNAAEANAWTRRGENVYKTLTSLLGTDKEVSKALSEMGFVGIKYPADYRRGGRDDGKKNYVIFNEKDAKITDHVRFFRTADGEAYGFTIGGKIYIDPRIANSETPVHEYAHLWATALRKGNAEEWKNVVGLMKDTKVWDEVKKRYPELKDDNDIADEVLATYSGRRGAERLRKEMDNADGKAKGALARVKQAIQKFWRNVADMLHIHYTSAEEVADRVMKDLLDGVDPRRVSADPVKGMERAAEKFREEQRLKLQKKDSEEDEMFVSLQNKKGKEYYDTVTELARRMVERTGILPRVERTEGEILGGQDNQWETSVGRNTNGRVGRFKSVVHCAAEIIATDTGRNTGNGFLSESSTGMERGQENTGILSASSTPSEISAADISSVGVASPVEREISKRIENWAKQTHNWLDWRTLRTKYDRSRQLGTGEEAESDVFLSKDGKSVLKIVRNPHIIYGTLLGKLNAVALQNHVFADDMQTIIGVTKVYEDGVETVGLVLEQPYVDGKPVAETFKTYKEINDYIESFMKNLGFKSEWYISQEELFKGEKSKVWRKGDIIVDDIHGNNVLIDADGKNHVIDCVAQSIEDWQKNNEPYHEGSTEQQRARQIGIEISHFEKEILEERKIIEYFKKARNEENKESLDGFIARHEQNIKDLQKEIEKEKASIDNGNIHYRTSTQQPRKLSESETHISETVAKTARKTGGKVKQVHSVEEITNEQVRKDIEDGKEVTGWYDEKTGEVHLYMPNIHDSYTAAKTIWHETVGHKGMRGLLGDKFHTYLRSLWMDMDSPVFEELHKYVKERMAKEPLSMYDAIEEFIADAAEKGKGEPGFWNNVKNKVVDALHEIGYRLCPNVKDVKYMLWLAKNVQKHGNDPVWKMRADAVKWKIEHEKTKYTTAEGGEIRSIDGKPHGFESMTKEEWNEATDGQVHYRTSPSAATALDRYHRMLARHGYMGIEAFADNMASVDRLMRALDPTIKKIEDVSAGMNPYMLRTVLDGAASDKMQRFEADVMQPLDKYMARMIDAVDGKNDKEKIRNFNLYMIKKHGLERNRVFFVRDAVKNMDEAKRKQTLADFNTKRKALGDQLRKGGLTLSQYYTELDKWICNNVNKDYKAGEHDYSGMHGMYGIDDKKSPYNDIQVQDEVMSAERAMEGIEKGSVEKFWGQVKVATQYSLDEDYQNGFVTKANHESVSDMFDWYVPLRKFDEETAEDVYGYVTEMGDSKTAIGPAIVKAKGRKSLSETNILAQIGAMANYAVVRGSQNKLKQAFALFVRRKGGQGLVTETKVWVEKVGTDMNGNDIWKEVQPDIQEGDTADNIAAKVEAFEQDMEQKKAQGKAKNLTDRGNNIGFKFERVKDKDQHFVDVAIAGKTCRFVINGNPRAAQALNGQLENSATKTWAGRQMKSLTRFMAQMATSYNPEFVLRNAIRDAGFALQNVTAREGVRYAAIYKAYYMKMLPVGAGKMHVGDIKGSTGWGLYAKYRNGTLDMNNNTEKWFKEFMENGGETGFVQIKNLQQWEKQYKRDILRERSLSAKTGKALKEIFIGNVECANEVVENMARFAAFCASRHIGRSVQRCAYDAKQVSVNFNRHGSGDAISSFKTPDMGNAKKLRRGIYGTTAGYLRNYSMFFNAGVQGTQMMFSNIKNAPIATIGTLMATPFAFGIAAAMVNAWRISNEDEKKRKGVKDPYAELPEYIRRNNLCFYLGEGKFATIPLAIEHRAFYGLGDIVAGLTTNPRLRNERNVAMDMTGCLSQLFPVIDFMNSAQFDKHPGLETVKGVTPTTLSPFVEWFMNSDWKGAPIRRVGDYSENRPSWKNAYSNTPERLIELNKWANAATNDVDPGNPNMKGSDWADALTDPSMLNHIIGTLGGGAVTTTMRAENALEKRQETEWNELPVLRNLRYVPQERTNMMRTKSRWYNYVEAMNKTIANYNELGNKNVPVDERIANIAARYKFENTDEYRKVDIIKRTEKQIKRLRKLRSRSLEDKAVTDGIGQQINLLIQDAVERLEEYDRVNKK